MPQSNRLLSALTTLVIIGSTMTFAYGQSLTLLSQYFSFSYLSLFIKVLLALAMLIIMFFARPRTEFHRVVVGAIGLITLSYAAYGAFSQSLPLGDAILYFIGAFIAVTESLEATFLRSKTTTPHTPAPRGL